MTEQSGPTEPTEPTDPTETPDLRPLSESSFAVEHGIVGAAPDVAISGPAVRRAREAVGLVPADIAAVMTRRLESFVEADLTAIEERPAVRLPARRARLLAAAMNTALADVEASAERWPADPTGVARLHAAGVDAVVLGDDVVVETAAGSYLGVLRCSGDITVLDTRTYRSVAATLLNGDWSHLAGALLVTEAEPHRALAVDALDCVSRSHAPSGLLGFSRLAEPEPVADALATYDRDYVVEWSDPQPLEALDAPADSTARTTARLVDLTDRLADEARRSRAAGKRPGYERAAEWLRSLRPDELEDLLDTLARNAGAAALDLLSAELEGGRR